MKILTATLLIIGALMAFIILKLKGHDFSKEKPYKFVLLGITFVLIYFSLTGDSF